MKFTQFSILITGVLALASVSPALAITKMGELSEYYIDYADVTQGASILSPCKSNPAAAQLESIITPRHDFFIFADGVEQHEEFTIDLGQERKVGMFIFEQSNATVYGGEVKRKPNSLTVQISTASANGPWTQVYKLDPADVIMSFALENVPARWVRYDLGVNTDGIGSRVMKAKIYKRYQLASGPELTKEFYTQFRRDADGLADFWKAVDAQNWEQACDALIEHYSKWPPEGKGEASPRVAAWLRNEVEGSGVIYKFESADWDWFRQKIDCPQPTLGGRPGGATILHLLKTAYAATGDEAYAKQLSLLLRDWLQDLPCPGVHRGQDGSIVSGWAGIVASQRTWSFGEMVHAMFKDNKYFDRDLKINLLYSLWQHISFMRQIFPELGGNWLTNANSCMFASAVDYPEFVAHKDWLEGSKSFFETSLTRDFFPSGRASEDSTMYVPIASNQITGQYDRMREAGITVSAEAQQRMEGLWDCETWVHYADQSVPAIGDAHRASPLDKPADLVPGNYLKWFDRPDLVYINTQGKQGTMPSQASRAFSDGGWYIMRTAWDTTPYEDARHMFFKCATGRGHGHPDQLEVTMYAYGREIITDPGMASYGTPYERYVVPTLAHSTVCVDEKDQSIAGGTEKAWVSATGADFVDGDFQGYKELYQRRQIVFLKPLEGAPDYWLVHDAITGVGNRKLDLNFHLSEGANPKIVSGSVCTTYPTGGNALIRLVDQSVRPELVESHIAALTSVTPTKTVRYRKEQAPPATFGTLVFPYNGANAPAVTAKPLKMDAETKDAIGVRVATDFGFDLIVMSTKPGSVLSFEKGRIKTDASALVIRVGKKGRIVYAFQAGGTYADFRGKRTLNVEPGATFSEKKAGQ